MTGRCLVLAVGLIAFLTPPSRAQVLTDPVAIIGIKLRLVIDNGTAFDRGRLEAGRQVLVNGSLTWHWGTVCDDGFGLLEATVACRQLGFQWGKNISIAEFGIGTSDIVMDNVGCRGTESSIADCRQSDWASTDCLHIEDTAVQCYNSSVKLDLPPGRDLRYGELELIRGGLFYRVCGQEFTDTSAAVACKELGYMTGRTFPHMSLYGMSKNTRELTAVIRCQGNETSLLDCRGATALGACAYNKPATVVCFNRIPNDTELQVTSSRLLGDDSPRWGKVQVRYYGVWVGICLDRPNNTIADVICRSSGSNHGLLFGSPTRQLLRRGSSSNPKLTRDLTCIGNETSLSDCDGWDDDDDLGVICNTNELNVLCYNNSVDITLYDQDKVSTGRGRVQLTIDGKTGTICNKKWSDRDAKVLCKQLGYVDGLASGKNTNQEPQFGSGTGIVWATGMTCSSRESHIVSCPYDRWDLSSSNNTCTNHTMDAGVLCSNKIRLKDGDGWSYGRVEMFTSRWGMVCGRGWDDKDAKVACRELGWDDGRSICCASFGSVRRVSTVRTQIRCIGNETSLTDCPYTFGYCPTSYRNYASVYCFNGNLENSSYTALVPEPFSQVDPQYAQFTGSVRTVVGGLQGRICEGGWDDTDADVACRELGFVGGNATRLSNAGTGPFLISEVNCTGKEKSLSKCPHKSAMGISCYREAGVLCHNSTGVKISLTLGKEGAVIMEYDGHSGYICNDIWSDESANTVCQQMGFISGTRQAHSPLSHPVKFMLSGVRCLGIESSILQCYSNGLGNPGTCSANDTVVAGVKCYQRVRIQTMNTHQPDPVLGQVLVYENSRWGGVCADGFNGKAASVVCRQLGFNYSSPLSPSSFKDFRGSVWVTGLNCNGTEDSILNCQYNKNGLCPNAFKNVAYVVCSNQPISNQTSLSFTGGSTTYAGRIRASRYGRFGKVCSSYWNDAAANVSCRQMGYKGGVALSYRIYSSDIVWLMDFNCTGNETRIDDCVKMKNTPKDCPTTRESGALCYMGEGVKYRLTKLGQDFGRVEIAYNGTWGSVCDDSWNTVDARVFCKSIGYKDGITRDISSVIHTLPTYAQYIGSLDCMGIESGLLQCPHMGWRQQASMSRCTPTHDAGVQCFASVRFEKGNVTGPVLMNLDSRWGYICDNQWGQNEATVACRHMGFSWGKPLCCSAFGRRYTYMYMVSKIKCSGAESQLEDCDITRGYCPLQNYASVICFNDDNNTEVIDFRVYGANPASGSFSGVVQVKYAGIWGNICPNGWDDKDARVVCTSLGFGSKGKAYRSNVVPSDTPFWMNDMQCIGTESSLADCPSAGLANMVGCTTNEAAGVLCYSLKGVEYDLVGGSRNKNYGRIEVAVDSVWGTVCDYGFGQADADAFCRGLDPKFLGGEPYANAHYGQGKGPIWMAGLSCSSEDKSILDCAHAGWLPTQNLLPELSNYRLRCRGHQDDVGVFCYGNVRLVGGPNRSFGRLEVFQNQRWYKICDDNSLKPPHAKAICQQLGYVDGQIMCCSALGEVEISKPTPYLGQVSCPENVTDMSTCNYTTVTCQQRAYVSIYCANFTLQNVSVAPNITLRSSGSGQYSGQLEVNIGGIEGRVCTKGWDDRDANATCKGLGFKGGRAFQVGAAKRLGPYIMGYVDCTGLENSLAECPYSAIGESTGCQFSDFEAGVLCYNESGITMRLYNTQPGTDNFGRVEIARDGTFGAVCSIGWGDDESRVVCRELGFADGAVYNSMRSPSQHPGRTWMMDVYCRGNESSLLQCNNRGWGNVPSYCNSYYYSAYVYCFDTVRLNRGRIMTGSHGAVEVLMDDQWRLVCDEGWDMADANVVCRQLGHLGGYPICCSSYGYNYRQIFISNVACNGSESSLLNCAYDSVGTSKLSGKGGDADGPDRPAGASRLKDCNYASAVCYDKPPTDDYTLQILSTGEAKYAGKIHVKFQSVWGRVCSDNWDDPAAGVVCKQLGYNSGQAYHHYEADVGYTSDGPWWTNNVICNGNETKMDECDMTPWGHVTNCKSGHSAGVLCYNQEGTFYRMVGGDDTYGRVELSVEGQWGTICDANWNAKAAKVFCRQIGFADGTARYGSRDGPGTGPVWVARMRCQGDELGLDECPHQGWRDRTQFSCDSHKRDAGVQCFQEVRIATQQRNVIQQAGALELLYKDRWYAICDTGFDDNTAISVCTRMGFKSGKAVCCSAYGRKTMMSSAVFNQTFQCYGNETSLTECIQDEACESENYASVICSNHTHIMEDPDFNIKNDNYNGQVVVSSMGVEGRVCSDDWDDADAGVLCSSLGYLGGIAFQHYEANHRLYPVIVIGNPDSKPYLYGNFNCSGLETSLTECPYSDRLTLNCTGNYSAGALCHNTTDAVVDYRLAGSDKENEGRVEVSVLGEWGTICNYHWDDSEARVFCRNHGYADGESIEKGPYGPGNGTIWLSHLQCEGTEQALHYCPHTGYDSSVSMPALRLGPAVPIFPPDGDIRFPKLPGSMCDHSQDAAVFCYNGVRLSLGHNASYGLVQVFNKGKWMEVSEDDSADLLASVACQGLGFPYGIPMPSNMFVTPPQNLSEHPGYQVVKCSGNEPSLDRCNMSESVVYTGVALAVYCSQLPKDLNNSSIALKKTPQTQTYNGAIQVSLGGLTGQVCSAGWGEAEANVTCRMLGYKGGVPSLNVGHGSSVIVLSNISCTGNESSLFDCNNTLWADPQQCPLKSGLPEAGVICYNDTGVQYRIGEGGGTLGRVEMAYDGVWGTICDMNWNMPDARVFCSQLGYKDGRPFKGNRFGGGKGPVYIESVLCQGDETILTMCRNMGWNYTQPTRSYYGCRQHRRDAGVECFKNPIEIKEVRINSKGPANKGLVEVYATEVDEWGTVCNDEFDNNDAAVLCRMAGYHTGVYIETGFTIGGRGEIWLDNLGCIGNETSIADCPNINIGVHDCYHYEDVHVECFNESTTVLPVTVPNVNVSSTATWSVSHPGSPFSTPTTVAVSSVPSTKGPLPATSTTVRQTTGPPVKSTSTSAPQTKPPATTTKPLLPSTTTRVTTTTPVPTPAPTTTSPTTTTSTSAPQTSTPTPPPTTPAPSPSTTTPPTSTPAPPPSTPAPPPSTPAPPPSTPAPPPSTPAPSTSTPTPTEGNTGAKRGRGDTPVVAVIIPLLIILLVAAAVLGWVVWKRRGVSRAKATSSHNGMSMSNIQNAAFVDNNAMEDLASDDSGGFVNKLYDLRLENPDLYDEMTGNNNAKVDLSVSEDATLTEHEQPTAMEDSPLTTDSKSSRA